MRTTQWRRAADIFAELFDMPAAALAERMKAACGNDEDLLAAVQSLLEQERRPDEVVDLGEGMAQALSDWSSAEVQEGNSFGAYRVLRVLGTGGMGQVYLAERQIDGDVQRVALKVPQQRPGKQFIERFRRERSILAGLGHPAIARLVDSGTLSDGRPYFAMEYVDGIAITDYCDQHRLDLRQRLLLFLRVLPAVQHAHENLVLHRDIKAANVLVGNDGLPRLLDFGIAKSVDAFASHAPTLDGARFFSLASAAPEQVLGAATSVATDVYALGALLYELACGLTVLDLEGLAPGQALAAITERAPQPPDAAVLTLAANDAERAQALAACRATHSAAALARQLRGDLALILSCALRKTARTRYASVDAFARDIQALLDMRPIAQRHGDGLYRLGRFLRRHRVAVVSAAAVIAFSLVNLVLALRQADAVAQARDRAEAGRAQAEQVTAFLIDLFRNADPTVARGTTPDAKQMLARGASALQSQLGDQPGLRATLMATLADIYLALNDFPSARQHAEQARAIRAAAHLQDAAAERASLEQLTQVALAEARYTDALGFLDSALQGRTLTAVSDDTELRLFGLRASALSGNGDRQQALTIFTAVVAEASRRYGDNHPRTRALERSQSLTLFALGETERALALAHVAAGDDPVPTSSNDPDTFQQAFRQASVLRDEGDGVAAERIAREALRIATVVFGEWHTKTASAYTLLGTIAQVRLDYDAAAEDFARSRAIVEHLFPINHPRRASAAYNLGLLHLLYRRDTAAALPLLRSAVEQAAVSLPADHANLAIFRLALGQALHSQREYAEARALMADALHSLHAIDPEPGAKQASAAGEIACIDLYEGRAPDQARAALQEAIDLLRREQAAGAERLARLEACAKQAL